jgi:hypothetical protein
MSEPEEAESEVGETAQQKEMAQEGVEGEEDDGIDAADEAKSQSTLAQLQKGARVVRVAAKVGDTTTNVAADVEDMYVAGDQKTADDAQTASEKDAAEIKRQAAFIMRDNELLSTLMKRLEEVFSTCATTISNEYQGKMRIAEGINVASTA